MDSHYANLFTSYTIRYWRLKAWRATQARDREVEARKALEAELERIRLIPKEDLEALIQKSKERQLKTLMGKASELSIPIDHRLNVSIDEKIAHYSQSIKRVTSRYVPSYTMKEKTKDESDTDSE